MPERVAPPVPEQQAAVGDRGRDLLLHAGAGSGKTRVLVERFCAVVCAAEGPDAEVGVEGILAFTFTERAAAELKRRIRVELGRRAAEEDAERARFLRGQAREAERAWVSTIHAFCQRLLASHPLAAGLDPRFRVLDESAARRLADEAFEAAFERFTSRADDDRFELAAAFRLRSLRELVVAAHDELRSRGLDAPRLPELPPPDVAGAAAELRRAAEAALAETAGASGKDAERFRGCMAESLRLLDGRMPSEDELEELCTFSSSASDFTGPAVERYREAVRKLGCRLVEAESFHHYGHVVELLELFAEEYRARKADRSGLDFEDLQLAARRLLRERPDLARRYGRQFAHIMVDEFQDTNGLQLELVRLLHEEDGRPLNRLFTVGDEFQSIYAFRHADVNVFRAERERVRALPERDAGVRELRGNFRSRPEILAAVNTVAAALLGPAFEELTVGVAPRGDQRGSGPAVEALVTERKGWDSEEVAFEVSPDEQAQPWRVAEARFLARRLRELCDEGFPRGEMVVLLRAFTHVDAYEEALAAEGLEPYVAGGRGYWSKQQVADLRQLLGALANPLDELALFGALASPACAVTPDTLWLLRQAAAERSLWYALRTLFGAPGRASENGSRPEAPGAAAEDEERRLAEEDWRERADAWARHVPEDDAASLSEFVRVFEALRDDAPRLGLEALVERALVDFGYDLALLMRRGGRRRMANVRKLMRIAREFERDEGPDLRRFLDWVEAEDALRPREGEAAVRAEGVRIMTVHDAKGLEFPLVAVADLGRQLGGGFPPALRLEPGTAVAGGPAGEPDEAPEPGPRRVGLRLARLGRKSKPIFDYQELRQEAERLDAEEERRILYVAMTRAQERLILSGACDTERLGAPPTSRTPLMDGVLEALGSDGSEGLVPVPPPSPRAGLELPLAPVRVGVSANRPTPRGAAEASGATRALPRPPEPPPSETGPLAHPALEPPAVASGAPTLTHVSYSALSLYERCGYRFYAERLLGMRPRRPVAAKPGGPGPGDEWPEGLELDGLGQRYARGTVVHELLERSARAGWESPAPEAVAALLRREGLPAGGRELERSTGLVEAFLASPLRAELGGARRLHPEAPFAFRLAGLIVRGEIDLLAELEQEVVVVDYKSDRVEDDPRALVDRYAVQREIYALAALRRYGKPVRVVYVFLERPAQPVEQRYGPADRDVLLARLAELTAGIEGGRFEVTERPGRELCFDCPARARLCTHPPERTLGERAEAP